MQDKKYFPLSRDNTKTFSQVSRALSFLGCKMEISTYLCKGILAKQ